MSREIDYSGLPAHMWEGTRLYIEEGIMTGGFLTAVMENDLVSSIGQADHINIRSMQEWTIFLYNEAPFGCWGSKKRVKSWMRKGGLNGIRSNARHSGTGD